MCINVCVCVCVCVCVFKLVEYRICFCVEVVVFCDHDLNNWASEMFMSIVNELY